MVVKTVGIYASMTLLCIAAMGQFNDSIHHYINYASTGIINKTKDVKSYVFTNALNLNISKKSVRLNSSTSWIYGEQQNQLSNNDFTTTLDFNLYKTLPHMYYWGIANYDKSYSLKINNRLQTGLGVAYNVFDKPKAWLNLSEGILYETSDLQINDSTNKAFQIFRNSFRLRYRFALTEVIVLDGFHLIQNSFSDNSDYIAKSVSTLTFKVQKWLGLSTSLGYNRNQRTNRENLLITFGLTADKYF